jgi:hypothetical protein
MRATAVMLFATSLLLGGARLFTGVDYAQDAPIMYFVLKRAPDLQIERTETVQRPVKADVVLDEEESQLAYFWIYFGLMRATPALAGVMVLGVAVLMAASGVRTRRLRPRTK